MRARRAQSTGQFHSQRELLQLSTEELTGRSGTTGQLDRDEYPPAIAAKGGAGAVIKYIEAGNNRRAGSLMGQQFAHYRIQPGERFRYAIIHGNMTGVEYLGDGTSEIQLEEPPANVGVGYPVDNGVGTQLAEPATD